MRNRIQHGLIGGGLGVVGAWLLWYGVSTTLLLKKLDQHAAVAEAKVLKHNTWTSRRTTYHELTVEFTPANGAKVTKTLDALGGDAIPAVESGRVQVRYLPDDPQQCAIGRMAIIPFQVVGGLGGLILLAGCLCVCHGFWSRQKNNPASVPHREEAPITAQDPQSDRHPQRAGQERNAA